MSAPLVSARNLTVRFATQKGPVDAVRGVSFDLGREKIGIVGESGSGKSTVGRALMRLLPRSATVAADRLVVCDTDVLAADEKIMRRIRGRRIGLIMQDPKYSLNPVVPVGLQIAETFRLHSPAHAGARAAREATLALLRQVRIHDPERVAGLYPHQISGGMGQRVMIAMVLAGGPEVLIADEPTSALDVTVRMEVLSLLDELVARKGLGLLFISHDLNLVRRFCDRVLIMYAGRVVEALKASEIDHAKHPYTQGLLASLPLIRQPREILPTLVRDPAWRESA
ncbi:ABC transporter ATP-binding protein [Alsobacter sp. SYSU M60028]|uniref:ABC transporter ATP-binding protein n=1 Tax=Alsobacter ponti TaxID=2962936 RepID=A0ABT1LFH8_9HYPH|nr:ABC transporter ATP-binding protein [Alsobacter ponti]MCP8939653.1 ABC transporter ATP-binding protein [Alsobacter ponti]